MAGSNTSPAKKPTRTRAVAAASDKSESLSPTAEALKALKTLASPTGANDLKHGSNEMTSNQRGSSNPTPATDHSSLRIQAPHAAIRSLIGSSDAATSGSSRASQASPAGSGPSAPTSPADESVDTPGGSGPTKRARLGADAASSATPTPPLFLEKTYEMLDKCSPQVACWSRAGDSFIVKNPVAFAEHVIPIYFKHKNFSSFVRQLNFYGFRKVRVVDPDVTGGVDPKDWWEFRHDKFLRGHKALLKEIKRRSLPSHTASGGSGSTPTGGGSGNAVATVDRGEVDELRAEVATLREQIQTLNKHMFSVMQIMMTRNAAPPPSTPTTAATPPPPPPQGLAFPSSHLVHHPHMFPPPTAHHHPHPQGPPPPHHVVSAYPLIGGLPPPHPTPAMLANGVAVAKNDKPRGGPPTVVSPGAAYALRPIQTFVAPSGVPPGYPYPLTPSGDPSVEWDVYSRQAFHAAQAAHAQAAAAAAAAATVSSGPAPHTPSTAASSSSTADQTAKATSSSVPALAGLKRSRSQQKRSPSSTASPSTSAPSSEAVVNPVDNPEAAVRQLSKQVTQIRSDLLQCILARTLNFIGTQPPATPSASTKSLVNPEIDAIAAAITLDIQQRMAQINEAEAITHGRPRGSPPSETSHMYRVEMLKFVSKELPRAMSEAVEKRLPAHTKKALNRSLLALMVQKAQAALETQMRLETASTSPSATSSSTTTTASASASGSASSGARSQGGKH